MPVNHRERPFEQAIEHSLLTAGGYAKGDPALFDRERALDPSILIPFIKTTQSKQWAPIEKYYGADAPKAVLDDLCKALESDGALTVIRHGFKCFAKLLRVAYFKPSHGMNPEAEKLYAANVLTVTRQLHYSTKNENSLDLVLSLNGLPIVTSELKNPLSGQTVEDAKAQYRNDRDPNVPIFAFKKRALVHFAVDPDLVFMATRLAAARATPSPGSPTGCRACTTSGTGRSSTRSSSSPTGWCWIASCRTQSTSSTTRKGR